MSAKLKSSTDSDLIPSRTGISIKSETADYDKDSAILKQRLEFANSEISELKERENIKDMMNEKMIKAFKDDSACMKTSIDNLEEDLLKYKSKVESQAKRIHELEEAQIKYKNKISDCENMINTLKSENEQIIVKNTIERENLGKKMQEGLGKFSCWSFVYHVLY